MERGILRRCVDAFGVGKGWRVANPFALVVETDDIHHRGQGHLRLGKIHRACRGPGGVLFVDNVTEFFRHGGAVFAGVLFADLVANAPQDHRRVVPVPSHERAHVLLMPVGKDQVKIQRRLFLQPDIEGLVQDEKTHPVRQLQQLRRRRVVTHPQRIAAHFPQHFQLALRRPDIERGAERAEIVMIVGSFDGDPFTVHIDSVVWIESDGSNPENSFIGVGQLSGSASTWSPPRSDSAFAAVADPRVWDSSA